MGKSVRHSTDDTIWQQSCRQGYRILEENGQPETVIVIDETDVRTGGREIARFGSVGNRNWTMKVFYHWVTEGRLITFTEELRDGDEVLTVALITFDFQKRGTTGSRLKLTDQITSFVGEGGVAGHRDGYTKALANLAASLIPA